MNGAKERVAVAIFVKNIEKRYHPTRCYMLLMNSFPIEAGEIDPNDRVLPTLSGSSVFARNEVYKVADKRRTEVSDYCNRLMTLQPKISQFPKLLEFLGVRTDDLNVSNKNNQSMLNSLGSVEFDITHPLQLQVYVAIADYKPVGKGQIQIKKGDQVDVIDKNLNGWWYVSCGGSEGWAPATFLDKLNPTEGEKDESLCLAGELFLSIKEYKGQFDDELSFDGMVVLEVLNKVLDGWWVASYNGKVGHVPSTYLKPYNDPHLKPLGAAALSAEGSNSPLLLPTPRRQSIKTPTGSLTKRDLQPYRRVTEKRRQRSIKQQKTATGEMAAFPANLSLILEDEDEVGYLIPNSSSPKPRRPSTDSGSYIDPDSIDLHTKGITPLKLNQRVPVPQSPRAIGVTSPSLDTRVAPSSSIIRDSDGYEPVEIYDKPQTPAQAVRADQPPAYNAPTPPPPDYNTPATPTNQPVAALRRQSKQSDDKTNAPTTNKTAPSSSPQASDEYDIVCSAPSSTDKTGQQQRKDSPKPPPAPPSTRSPGGNNSKSPSSNHKTPPLRNLLNAKVPPPKPAAEKLTRLSKNEWEEYEYSPIPERLTPPSLLSNSNQSPSPPIRNEQPKSFSAEARKKPVAISGSAPEKAAAHDYINVKSYSKDAPHTLQNGISQPKSSFAETAPTTRSKHAVATPKVASHEYVNVTSYNKESTHTAPPKPARRKPPQSADAGTSRPTFPLQSANRSSTSLPGKLAPNMLAAFALRKPRNGGKNATSPALIKCHPQEVNNNVSKDLESDGKVYEEVLIKPSQLKGMKSAELRKPK